MCSYVTDLYGVQDFRFSVGLCISGDVTVELCLVRWFWNVEHTVLELNSTSRQQITCNWNTTSTSRSAHSSKQISLKYECTIDQELSMLLHRRREDTLCWLTRWQHLSVWNDIKAASLKVWRQMENVTSVNQCVFTWKTFLPNYIRIRFEMTEP